MTPHPHGFFAALFAAILLVLAPVPELAAHRSGVPFFVSLDGRSDGSLAIEVEVDPLLVGLQAPPREKRPLEAAECAQLERFVREVLEIRFGEEPPTEHDWETREADFEPPEDPSEPVHLIAHFELDLPEKATQISLRLGELTGSNLFLMYQKDGVPSRRHAILFPGETSREWLLPPHAAEAQAPPKEEAAAQEPEGEGWKLFVRHLGEGFRHVIPSGWDHALFMLALFLLSPRFRDLLLQATLFTVAHTVTLGLASTGKIDAPASIVEPIIAASIAVVALESLFMRRVTRWRLLLVFLFGLVHGLGFAGQFRALPLPTGSLLLGLVGFNIGVEVAQLALLAGAFLVYALLPKKAWQPIRVTSCLVIAGIGLFLVIERLAA